MLWKLPRERVKNATSHTVPLAPRAWAIIAAQPRFAGCGFIFTNDGRQPVGGFSRLKCDLDKSMQLAMPSTPHDVRRSMASELQRLGVRVEVIEAALNHRSGTFQGDHRNLSASRLHRRAAHRSAALGGLRRAARRRHARQSGVLAGGSP